MKSWQWSEGVQERMPGEMQRNSKYLVTAPLNIPSISFNSWLQHSSCWRQDL